MAKFEASIVKNYDNFNEIIARFVLKKLLESKTLLSINIFQINPLNIPEIGIVVFTYSIIPGALNMAIFGIFQCAPYISVIL